MKTYFIFCLLSLALANCQNEKPVAKKKSEKKPEVEKDLESAQQQPETPAAPSPFVWDGANDRSNSRYSVVVAP